MANLRFELVTPRGVVYADDNVDMVIVPGSDGELGILPNHHLWNSFFKNLRYVVIDEAHVYRGVVEATRGCGGRRWLWLRTRGCHRRGRPC